MQLRIGRRMALAVAGAMVAVGAVAVVGPTGPAHADPAAPHREDATSDHNAFQVVKEATAACPWPLRVYAAGARVNGNNAGRVILTAVEPDQALTSVTVQAVAGPGQAQPWSVTAFAVCELSHWPVERKAGPGNGSSATAECDDGRVYGTGFRLDLGDAPSYLTALVPSDDRTEVRVTVGGAAPNGLTAYAICHDSQQPEIGRRLHTAVALVPTGPVTATIDVADPHVFGVGGRVRGADPTGAPPAGVHIDAVVPHLGGHAASVRAVRHSPASGAASVRATVRATVSDDGEGELDAFVVADEIFH